VFRRLVFLQVERNMNVRPWMAILLALAAPLTAVA